MKNYLISALILSSLTSCKHENSNKEKSSLSAIEDAAPLSQTSMFDVSILYPFPNESNSNIFITSQNNILPQFSLGFSTMTASQLKSLYAVGIRLDPCFPGIVQHISECKSQIRLVMQPIPVGETPPDTAIHVFYDMTQSKLSEVVNSIISLRKKYGIEIQDDMPLQIHPGLAKENKEFALALKKLILENISKPQVSRITGAFGQRNSTWDFVGIDIKSGSQKAIVIPGLESNSTVAKFNFLSFPIGDPNAFEGASSSDLVSGAFNPGGSLSQPVGSFEPKLKQGNSVDDISYLLSLEDHQVNSFVANVGSTMELNKIKSNVTAAYKIENPTIHTPESISCGACHVARQTITKGYVATVDQNFSQVKYKNDMNLNLSMHYKSNINFTNMRAFGYFHQNPTISQRTINETAEVVKHFRKP